MRFWILLRYFILDKGGEYMFINVCLSPKISHLTDRNRPSGSDSLEIKLNDIDLLIKIHTPLLLDV